MHMNSMSLKSALVVFLLIHCVCATYSPVSSKETIGVYNTPVFNILSSGSRISQLVSDEDSAYFFAFVASEQKTTTVYTLESSRLGQGDTSSNTGVKLQDASIDVTEDLICGCYMTDRRLHALFWRDGFLRFWDKGGSNQVLQYDTQMTANNNSWIICDSNEDIITVVSGNVVKAFSLSGDKPTTISTVGTEEFSATPVNDIAYKMQDSLLLLLSDSLMTRLSVRYWSRENPVSFSFLDNDEKCLKIARSSTDRVYVFTSKSSLFAIDTYSRYPYWNLGRTSGLAVPASCIPEHMIAHQLDEQRLVLFCNDSGTMTARILYTYDNCNSSSTSGDDTIYGGENQMVFDTLGYSSTTGPVVFATALSSLRVIALNVGCSAGTHAQSSEINVCRGCDSGEFYGGGVQIECDKCPTGQHSTDDRKYCTSCVQGQFASEMGQSTCALCDISGYQDDSGQSSCKDCAPNTQTSTEGATSETQCFPKRGYWQLPNSQDVVQCIPSKACAGGENSPCTNGYSGFRCGECASGYYRLGEECYQCGNGSVVLFILFFGVLLVLMIVLTKAAGGVTYFKSLSMTLSYLQVTAFFGTLNVPWPSHVAALLNVLSIFNFNLELTQPECQSTALRSPFTKWLLMVLFPLIILLLLGVVAIFLLLNIWKKKNLSAGKTSKNIEETRERTLSQMASSNQSQLTLKKLMAEDEERIRFERYGSKYSSVVDRCFGAFAIFLVVAYLFLGQTALEVFDCTNESGRLLYDVQPSLQCYSDDEHWKMVYVAIFVTPFYVIGIPMFLNYYMKKSIYQIGRPKMSTRIGFLVNRYQRRFCNWEVAVMLRKVGLVSCQLFFTSKPLYSTSLVLIILFISIVTHVKFSPYTERRLFNEETFLLINNFFVLFSGILFLAGFSSSDESDAVGWMVVLFIVLALVYIVINLGQEACTIERIARFFLRRQTSRLVLVKRKVKAYCSRSIRPQYLSKCIQWLTRIRQADLYALHRTLRTIRRESSAVQIIFDGLFPDDMKDKVRTKESEDNAVNMEDVDDDEADPGKDESSDLLTSLYIYGKEGEAVNIDDLTKSTVLFTHTFRLALLEWTSHTSDMELRLFQHAVEILEENVVQPTNAILQKGGEVSEIGVPVVEQVEVSDPQEGSDNSKVVVNSQ